MKQLKRLTTFASAFFLTLVFYPQVLMSSIADNLERITQEILSSSPGYSAIETWQQFMEELSFSYQDLMLSDPELAEIISQDLAVWLQQHPELQKMLTQSAQAILENKNASILQNHFANCFLQNGNKILHLQGNLEENAAQREKTFTIFDCANDDVSDDVLSSNADILHFRNVHYAVNEKLYEALKNSYAHFYFVTEENICIASKYPLEKLKVQSLSQKNSHVLDFVIQNGDSSVGHIYSVNPGLSTDNLMQLINIMQNDLLDTIEKENMPFFLCGNTESNDLLNFYFRSDASGNDQAMLLQVIPAYPEDKFGQEYELTSQKYQNGLLTKIHENPEILNALAIQYLSHNNLYENNSLLAKDKASASASTDTDGNVDLELEYTHTESDDDGKSLSFGGSIDFKRSSDGKTSAEGKLKLDLEF